MCAARFRRLVRDLDNANEINKIVCVPTGTSHDLPVLVSWHKRETLTDVFVGLRACLWFSCHLQRIVFVCVWCGVCVCGRGSVCVTEREREREGERARTREREKWREGGRIKL